MTPTNALPSFAIPCWFNRKWGSKYSFSMTFWEFFVFVLICVQADGFAKETVIMPHLNSNRWNSALLCTRDNLEKLLKSMEHFLQLKAESFCWKLASELWGSLHVLERQRGKCCFRFTVVETWPHHWVHPPEFCLFQKKSALREVITQCGELSALSCAGVSLEPILCCKHREFPLALHSVWPCRNTYTNTKLLQKGNKLHK